MMKKRVMIGFVILSLVVAVFGLPMTLKVSKADAVVKDVSTGSIALSGGGEFILTGETDNATNVVTIAAADNPYVITLDSLSMKSTTKVPISVQKGAMVTFVSLEGNENNIYAVAAGMAAIEVQTGATAVFEGNGTIKATCNRRGAAIGGCTTGDSTTKDYGTIIINGGTIVADSTDPTSGTAGSGAAIGGGYNSGGGTIIINGGNITAKATNNASAIGDGHNSQASKASTIIINGGTIVTAITDSTASTNDGIGYPYQGPKDTANSPVTINGGNIISSFRKISSTASVYNRYSQVTIDCSEISSDDSIDSVYVNGKNYNVTDLTDGKKLTVYVPKTYVSGSGGTAVYTAADCYVSVKDEGKTYIYDVTYSDRTTTESFLTDKSIQTLKHELTDAFEFNGASIRTTGKTGIRFSNNISDTLRDATIGGGDGYEIEEYGVLVQKNAKLTVSSTDLADSPGSRVDFTLDSTTLAPTTGIKGVAYKKGETDIVFAQSEGKTTYTAVLWNIAETNYATDYAVKPYIVLNDTDENRYIIYGESNTRSLYGVAKAALNDSEAGLSSNEKAYLESIVSTVEQ